MASRIFRTDLDRSPPTGMIWVGSMGWRETMAAGCLSYPKGLSCWLLMVFHEAGACPAGQRGAAPGCFLWAPGEPQIYGNPDAPWTHSWLHLAGDRLEACLENAGLAPGRFYPCRRGDALADSYFARLFNERSLFHPPSAGVLGAQAESFLHELGRSLAEAGGGALPEPVMRAKRYLDAHLSRRVALDELAREAGVSVPHLCAQFKQIYGESPGRYHLRSRMDLAAFYLAVRGLPVSEVAERIGYPDVFSFSRMFKRLRGTPPSRLP